MARIAPDATLVDLVLHRGAARPRGDRPLLNLHIDGQARWSQAYVPGTNVLETTIHAGDGELQIVDFMPLAEARAGQGDSVARGAFIRIITCTEGSVSLRLAHGIAPGIAFSCSRPVASTGDVSTTAARLSRGESIAVMLSGTAETVTLPQALHDLGDTMHYWSWWSDRCRYTDEDASERLREALGLKLAMGANGEGLLNDDGQPASPAERARAASLFAALGFRNEASQLVDSVAAEPPCLRGDGAQVRMMSDSPLR